MSLDRKVGRRSPLLLSLLDLQLHLVVVWVMQEIAEIEDSGIEREFAELLDALE